MSITYYAPDEMGEMQPDGTWVGTDYCWVRREDYAKLEQQLADMAGEKATAMKALFVAARERQEFEQQLAKLRGLMSEALSNMEYYPASLGEYWLVQDSDITAMQEALQERGE